MPRVEKKATPTILPPELEAMAGLHVLQDAPTLTIEQIARVQTKREDGAPVLTPPAEVAEEGAGEMAITAWHNAVRVTALWCNASARNAFAAIEGIGWRRVNPANDSAFLAITAMLSHARQMNASCNVRIEADNLIHEVYVW